MDDLVEACVTQILAIEALLMLGAFEFNKKDFQFCVISIKTGGEESQKLRKLKFIQKFQQFHRWKAMHGPTY